MRSALFVLALLYFSGCTGDNQQAEKDTPVYGTFSIYTDETYYPLVKILTDGFMSVYPNTNISIDTTSGGNVYAKLADSGARAIITARSKSSSDSTALAQRSIFPTSFHFASDALVLIEKYKGDSGTHFVMLDTMKNCLDSTLSPRASKIVTDRNGSENNDFIYRKFQGSKGCKQQWMAAGNQQSVISYIAQHENEVGIVGWSYLCDKDDPAMMELRKQVSVIPFGTDSSEFIWPTQSALVTEKYPLVRKLYLVTADPYAGTATGFASYVASDEGQRIVRLFGLAPAKTPPREIFIQQ